MTTLWGIIRDLSPIKPQKMNGAIPPRSAKANHLQILMFDDVSFCALFVRGLLVVFFVLTIDKKKQHKTGTHRKCETEIDWCLVNEQEMARLNLK